MVSENGGAEAGWEKFVDARFSPLVRSEVSAAGRLAMLDAEVLSVKKAYIRALRLRNAGTSLLRLPSEVLTSILEQLKAFWPPSRRSGGHKSIVYQSGWFTTAHVCSRMREIALNSPSLWATHVNAQDISPNFIPATLLRSRDLLIDITYKWDEAIEFERPSGRSTHPMELWLSPALAHRTRRLCLREFISAKRWPVTEIPREMPQLQELVIIGLPLSESCPAFELPPHLHSMSQIRRLSLRYYRPPWDSAVFSANMVYLKLGFLDKVTLACLPTLDQFQAMLSRLPTLETLILENIHPQDCDDTDKISLPSTLRLFQLHTMHENVDRALQFTTCLRIPAQCSTLFRMQDSTFSHIRSGGSVAPKASEALVERCISNIFQFDDQDDSPQFRELIFNMCTVAGFVDTQPREHWTKGWYATPNQYEIAWQGRYRDPRFESPTRHLSSIGNVPGPGFFHTNVTLEHALAITFSANLLEIHNAVRLDYLASHATIVRRLGIIIPYPSASSLLHMLAEHLSSAPSLDEGNLRAPLFPLLETLVIHVKESVLRGAMFIAESTALTNVILARKRSDVVLPLREIIISKAAENWAVWDTLRDEVAVTFF
ncbi:unnamed protein product [Peniophora sp. CBMAI 1063]|nr:unnamed protein product [Peniophora sp. CBMAI 1063]